MASTSKTARRQFKFECHQNGREIASTRSQLPLEIFPEQAIANLEQILDQNWLPN